LADYEKIKMMIAYNSPKILTLKTCTVFLQQTRPILPNQKEQENKETRLVIQPKNTFTKGLIIYSNGYYHGTITDNAANSTNGELHLVKVHG
jgi:hypothetical protein